MNNVRRAHFSVLEWAEDHGLSRTMEFEVHIPILGQAGSRRRRSLGVCSSISCRAIIPLPPQLWSRIQSKPGPQNVGIDAAQQRRTSFPGRASSTAKYALKTRILGDWLIQKGRVPPRVTQLSGLGASPG